MLLKIVKPKKKQVMFIKVFRLNNKLKVLLLKILTSFYIIVF